MTKPLNFRKPPTGARPAGSKEPLSGDPRRAMRGIEVKRGRLHNDDNSRALGVAPGGEENEGEDQRAACHDKTGPASEVINRAARCSRAVFRRVTPVRAHRSDRAERRATIRGRHENQSRDAFNFLAEEERGSRLAEPREQPPRGAATSRDDMLKRLLSKSGRRLLRVRRRRRLFPSVPSFSAAHTPTQFPQTRVTHASPTWPHRTSFPTISVRLFGV